MLLRRIMPVLLLPLLALAAAAQDATPTPLPTFPITPGSYEGNISDSFYSVRYSFEAAEGDVVTISMNNTSGNLDPFLFLFGPGDVLVDSNDDVGPGDRNSRIEYTVERAGSYVIEATRFDGERGTTSGTYRLVLALQGAQGGEESVDPLSLPPAFGVAFNFLDYEEFGTGSLSDSQQQQYFVLGGQQGDFVRVILTVTDGTLQPELSIRNADLVVISQQAGGREGEVVVYATLPAAGWYLIEARLAGGSGSYSLYATRLAGGVVEPGQLVTGSFVSDAPVVSYVFSAAIGDQVFASLTSLSAQGAIHPEVAILDLNLQPLDLQASEGVQARARTVIPRSGTYILRVRDTLAADGGNYSVALRLVPVEIDKLPVQVVSYNNTYKGSIDNQNPINYYRFAGKAGELVTLDMRAVDVPGAAGILDPFLILTDAELNELAFNDNVAGTRNARIVQYALPADGDYYVLATRPGLILGSSTGEYDLEITVGQIALASGRLAVTLNWSGDADLSLFVRDPDGRTVSWSMPLVPSGGRLQIDSNTGCATPTAQPVEHIYWPVAELPEGEYVIWAWYQNVCRRPDPVDFTLVVAVDGQEVLHVGPGDAVLRPDERFEASIRVAGDSSFVVNPGSISRPSPQQRASQGGDTLILYDQSLQGTLNDEVFALFYQFVGQAGDRVLITAERLTGGLDTVLVLRDLDNHNLAMNDDAGPGTKNSALVYTLPEAGHYVIAVTRFGLRDGITSGDFRLTLTLLEQGVLEGPEDGDEAG